MNTNGVWSAILVALSVATTACSFEHSSQLMSPTLPTFEGATAPGTAGLMGLWTSGDPTVPSSWVCGSFQWNITEQTESSLAGSFSGLCGGVIVIEGAGNAQLNGNTVTLEVSGQATASGVITTCPFSLNATGLIEGEDAIHVTYSGSTCFGPVQGTETLRRPASLPGAPTPPPAGNPPPSSNPSAHVSPGPLTADLAWQVLQATANEYPHLAGAHPTGEQAAAAAEELLLRYIWRLKLAGFDAGRQRNPSGAISGDKLTIFLDGQWKAFDIFFDVGAADRPLELIFWEVFPADHVPHGGIPD